MFITPVLLFFLPHQAHQQKIRSGPIKHTQISKGFFRKGMTKTVPENPHQLVLSAN